MPRDARSPAKSPRRLSSDSPADHGTTRLFNRVTAASRFGVGVVLAVSERSGDEIRTYCGRFERFSAKPGHRPRTALLGLADPPAVARLMSGLAHPDRVRIVRAILAGADSHQTLSKASGLKAGPLYHHLRELERAGFLRCELRNQHRVTELGRVVFFAGTLLAHRGRNQWTMRSNSKQSPRGAVSTRRAGQPRA